MEPLKNQESLVKIEVGIPMGRDVDFKIPTAKIFDKKTVFQWLLNMTIKIRLSYHRQPAN